jgi:hypothetical protein
MSMGGNEEPLLSSGEFRGYAAFSTETALVLKLDDSHGPDAGHVRFIPYHAILVIDVLELAPRQPQEQKEDNRVYYR